MVARFRPLPPREAIAALRARGMTLDASFAWQDVYAEEHAAMFTVAKSAGYDILDDIWATLLASLEDGRTFREFAADLEPVLRARGWWGKETVTEPQTGETRVIQLGSPRRLETIFGVNMRVSHAAGHWSRFERMKAERPFLRYVAILDERTRQSHAALHNLVLPFDHPFWDVFAPPNGWNCRCTLQNFNQTDIDRLVARGVPLRFEPPEITYRDWTNRRTGEVRRIPDGIDPGWDYNPGKSGHQETKRRLETRTVR
ncbi:phage minor head protein [Oricola sp.]|uniref:phage head morphogenesis protein n=1 Tax=Oricola sp. TaxID=1979950 RepID=UPI0025F6B5F1|nr:phage minor head protein [Oricola sp.]MCI5075560.1 minor capsid protein [Oricola sp.]